MNWSERFACDSQLVGSSKVMGWIDEMAGET